MSRWLLTLLTIALALPAHAAMVHQAVEYQLGDAHFVGMLIFADAVETPRPALLMVPNWYGVNAAAVKKAEAIAADDYVIFLADLYGKEVRPTNADEARAAVGPLLKDRATLRARINAAMQALRQQADSAPIDPKRIAAIGFCFGGTAVLDLARSGADVAAVVSFHGGLASDDVTLARNIKAAVLAMDGADDEGTIADAPAFRDEMRQSPADWQLVVFGHAVHCFTEVGEDSPGCRYDAKVAARSYQMMRQWLVEAFAAGKGG